jgi:hypothetical protein
MPMRTAFWDILRRARLAYPTMHLVATVQEALGFRGRRDVYRQDLMFRIYEFVARHRPRQAPSSRGPNVLFGSIRGSVPLVTSLEGMLGHALQMRGAKVSSVACDGVLTRCDGYLLRNITPERCARCACNSRSVMEAFGLPHHALSTFITAQDTAEARQLVQGIPRDSLDGLVVDGLPLGDYAMYSARYNTQQYRPAQTDETTQLHREFLQNAVVLVRAYTRLLDSVRPDVVVLLNGLYMTFRILMELARRRNIPVYTYERGYHRYSWAFSRNQPAALVPLDSKWASVKDQPLRAEQAAQLDAYLASRRAGCLDNITPLNTEPEERKEVIWRELGLDPGKPTATLFPNSFTDSSTMDLDGAFSDIFDWIDHTVRFFAERPEYQLILRAHPAEVLDPNATESLAGVLKERHPRLPENIRYVPPESKISSYQLLQLSRASLVYVSTIGIESALQGVPCLLVGRPHYRGRGFTTDVESTDQYRSLLQRLPDLQPLSTEEIEVARRFAYLLFFRHECIFPWFREVDNWTISDIALDSLADLAPGRDPRLDALCQAILTGNEVPVE